MNLTAADIDQIVAEVVRRLRILMATSSTPATASSAQPAAPTVVPPPAAEVSKSTDLHLVENVITVSTLKDRLSGVTKVLVGQRAVLTPAAKDELRQRKITWERSTKARS